MALAAHFEVEGDYRRAQLALEQLVQIHPDSIEARQRLADFYERTGQPLAMDAWREAIRLEPGNPENQLGLTGAALRFGDLETVRQTLQQLREARQTGPDYYRFSAGLAMATRNPVALEESLAEMSRLQPEDQQVRINLALARMQLPDPDKVEVGRASLIELAKEDAVRIRAVVELFNDIARRWPEPTTERIVAFQHLALELTRAQGPRLDAPENSDPVVRLLTYAMLQPGPAPADVVLLLRWMAANGRAATAFAWIDSLPPATRGAPQVLAASGEVALQTADWALLHELLRTGAWGAVPAVTVDRAFDARVNVGREEPAMAAADWTAAVEASRTSLSGLRILLRLSETWDWPDERREVLQTVTESFPAEKWAWRQLVSYALARGESEELWQIYQRWNRTRPGNSTVRMEMAIMGLLLDKTGAPGVKTTGEFVRLQPDNPAAVVAHALALWRQDRLEGALSFLDRLPRAVLTEPRYALVYGLLLAEAGRRAESEPLLQRGLEGRLLPEERSLIELARGRNARNLP